MKNYPNKMLKPKDEGCDCISCQPRRVSAVGRPEISTKCPRAGLKKKVK